MTARVSVIISTKNRKATLSRAVKSVLEQSFKELELLIVDDCSTDGTAAVAKEFMAQDARVRYFKTEKSVGHDGPVKNLGILYAQGEYVCFLDDDDFYRRDALKVLMAYAKESKSDVTYGDYLIDGKAGWSIDFSVARLAQHNYISMVVALVRREVLLKVGGFDEAVPKFKDWNLWLRIQKSGGSFIHVPIIVAEVTAQSKGSVSEIFGNEKRADGSYLPTYFNPADCSIYPDKTSIGTKKPLRVAIYTLAMNRLEYTKRMYASICATAGYEFDWFVIDQGSTDGTGEWLKSLQRDRTIKTNAEGVSDNWRKALRYRLYELNVGLSKGWNNIVAFIKSEGEYDIIVKVDNDAELMSAGWLKAMVDIYDRNRKLILSPYVEGLEGSPGGVLRQRASGDSPYMMINDRVLGLVPNLGGIVFATPIELWKDWKFEESYEGNKDYLLSQYARKHGYSLFYMEEFRVWHIDGTAGQHQKFPGYFKGRSDFKAPEEEIPEEPKA